MGKTQFAVAIGVSLTAFCVLAGPSSADFDLDFNGSGRAGL